MLGVKGQGGIGFFDWQTGGLVRRIEVDPKEVCWFFKGWFNLADTRRSTGLRMANWSRLLVKTHFTFFGFREKIMLLLCRMTRLRMMVSRLPSKWSQTSTRGNFNKHLEVHHY